MEGCRDGQLDTALDAVILRQRNRAFDGLGVTRDDHLRRVVVIRDFAHLPFGSGFGQRAGLLDIGTQQCGHRAHTDRHRVLHRDAAQP